MSVIFDRDPVHHSWKTRALEAEKGWVDCASDYQSIGKELAAAQDEIIRLRAALDEAEKDSIPFATWDKLSDSYLKETNEQKSTITAQAERIKELEAERNRLASDALTALAGIVCTPVEGYVLAPQCLKSNILELRKMYVDATRAALERAVEIVHKRWLDNNDDSVFAGGQRNEDLDIIAALKAERKVEG